MAQVELNDIKKAFGKTEVIHGVNLSIQSGDFVVFVGPSGCGKSTLLRLISGLEKITSGRLTLDGVDVTHKAPSERGISMVFQSYALYPHMSAYENMAFGLKLAKTDKQTVADRVSGVANMLQLSDLLDRLPKHLSGGQQQRVAIGRAIVRSPKIFLFDEPLSNLDAALRVQTRIEIAEMHERMNATMIYVTHDQIEAMTLADHIVVLRDGTVEQAASPLEIYHNPANQFVAGFIGSHKMNFLKAHATQGSRSDIEVTLNDGSTAILTDRPSTLPVGHIAKVGVRPEHFSLSPKEGSALFCTAFVKRIERLGEYSLVYLDNASGEQMLLKTDQDLPSGSGDSVRLFAHSSQIHLFNSEGRNVAL